MLQWRRPADQQPRCTRRSGSDGLVVICDNDSIHHARAVTAYLEDHPRLELLYGARYSPHDNPAKRV